MKWLEMHCLEKYEIYSGKIVNRLDGIRFSMVSCFEKREKKLSNEYVIDKQAVRDEVKNLNIREEQQKKICEEILVYLEAHYRDEELSQTLVADVFRISNYTPSRMFKSHVGVGFTEYINAKRLEYAKELLLTTSYSIREISIMVGFSNDNYFSRLFKAMVGVSPTVFREK